MQTPKLNRRRLLQGVLTMSATAGFPLKSLAQAVNDASKDIEQITWSACTVNCGSRCPLRIVSKNGQVIRVETDNTGSSCSCAFGNDFPQVRACLRGRSVRQRIYSAERLKYPMKRVGERGEGKFERISWDQALDEIAGKLKGIISKYGNEAVFINHGSGNNGIAMNSRKCAQRFFNLIGGNLNFFSDYSAGQFQNAWPYLYGGYDKSGYTSAIRSQDTNVGSYMEQIANAKLYVGFGNNPAVTRASGGGQSYGFTCSLEKGKPRVIMIDPIYSDSMMGREDEWVPIKPGTDAALVEGMAYVMITENLVDQPFLDKYCVGYDEKTLPKSAPRNADYKSYILGKGPDGTPKTPQWAAKETGVPSETIIRLAREIATTKPLFVAQGWGPQRRGNGDSLCNAIAMLPILTGQLGLPGTNNGAREADQNGYAASLPVPPNPVKASVCLNVWHRAIYEADKLTAKNGLAKGCDALRQNIKFMWETQGNNVINQHTNSNLMSKLLKDPQLVECFVVVDTQMTPTAKFADYLLPDVAGQENTDFSGDSYSVGGHCYIIPMQKAVEPQYGQKRNWDIMREMAKRFGVEDKYTEGKTYDQWLLQCYEATRRNVPELPASFSEFMKGGIVKYKVKDDSGITMENFRKDPAKYPIKTPSGKIEIYSEKLADLAKNTELPEGQGQCIKPIPSYVVCQEMPGHGDPLEKKYPLECFGYHGQGHVHSSYANLPWINELQPDELLINPLDAEPRNIRSGDVVLVKNDRGTLQIKAKVTPRIIPGAVALPQGAWYKPNPKTGVDEGACMNTLTGGQVSPISKGSPMHTNLVEVVLA